MSEDTTDRLVVIVAATTISATKAYPDGSRIQLTMPKPPGVDGQTADQIEQLARRLARRLLGVVLEDIADAG